MSAVDSLSAVSNSAELSVNADSSGDASATRPSVSNVVFGQNVNILSQVGPESSESSTVLSGIEKIVKAFESFLDKLTATLQKFIETETALIEKASKDTKATSSDTTKSDSATSSNDKTSATDSSADKPAGNSTAALTFSEKLKMVLSPDKNGQVDEAELRRGVVLYQLYQKKPELGDAFDKNYKAARDGGASPTASLEKALLSLVSSKDISRAEANWVYSLSRRAANFDTSAKDRDVISTTGGISLDAAIKFAEASLAGIQAGNVEVKPLTI